jgi:hypothetical protein
MNAWSIRFPWLVVAAAIVTACGRGDPGADASLESAEQAISGCPDPLCSSVCSCATSCTTSCCTTSTGTRTTCGALSTAKCVGKVACTCGNGVCDGSETTANCEKDCPECHNAGTDPNGCGYSCSRPGSTDDRDVDGVPDQLEYLLAHKFFPNLWARWDISDKQQFYANAPQTSTVPYSVRFQKIVPKTGPCSTASNMCIEIVYGMAYHRDCGDNPNNGCSGINNHLGDSEFYILLLKRTVAWDTAKTRPSSWQLIGDFTSAHFGTSTDSSSVARYGVALKSCFGLYGYDANRCMADLECRMNFMSTPHCEDACFSISASGTPLSSRATIYASEGKHAMYHSLAACDAGGFGGADFCQANINLRGGKTCYNLQNVGNKGTDSAFKRFIRTPASSSDGYDVWGGAKFGAASDYRFPFTTAVAYCMQ